MCGSGPPWGSETIALSRTVGGLIGVGAAISFHTSMIANRKAGSVTFELADKGISMASRTSVIDGIKENPPVRPSPIPSAEEIPGGGPKLSKRTTDPSTEGHRVNKQRAINATLRFIAPSRLNTAPAPVNHH
jgi:hypothetical protein